MKRATAPEPFVLVLGREVAELGTECRQPRPVALLPALDRSVELALGDAPRAFDARPPGQFVQWSEPVEVGEGGFPAVTARRGAARPDAGRVDEKRAEQPVDVVGNPDARGTGGLVLGDETVTRGAQNAELFLGEPQGHQMSRWAQVHASRHRTTAPLPDIGVTVPSGSRRDVTSWTALIVGRRPGVAEAVMEATEQTSVLLDGEAAGGVGDDVVGLARRCGHVTELMRALAVSELDGPTRRP